MAFFPRVFHNELAQVARLMDEVASIQVARPAIYYPTSSPCSGNNRRAFQQPRFDVKENRDSYELSGELPGYTDVNVEFTDASTLRIKGRSEHSREKATQPAQSTAGKQSAQATAADNTDTTTPSTTAAAAEEADSSQYHKASVEDENWVDARTNEDAEPTPSSSDTVSPATATETPGPAPEAAPAKIAEPRESRYWLSERSVGEFARTFTFPARVDQDAVKASLKNGILSVLVPKALPATRRITVE